MAELKEVLQGVLVKSHNWTDTEVSSLFNEDGSLKDDALDSILNKQAEVVEKQRAKAKAERDAQLQRGRRERGEELEKALKAAGVELEGATGEEAVEKFKAALEAKAKPSELEEDKVKTHPAYTKREKELLAQITAKEKEVADKLAERDAKDQRERTLSKVKQRAEELKSVLKPVLPDDEKIAKSQLRLLDLDINAVEFETDEDGTVLLKKDGKRLEKDNGHPMSLDEYLEGAIRSNFQIQVSDKKGSAGDPTKGTVKGAVALKKPANRKELADQLAKIVDDPTLKASEKAEQAAALQELAKDVAA